MPNIFQHVYKVEHQMRGRAVIINNEEFESTDNNRQGNEQLVNLLCDITADDKNE